MLTTILTTLNKSYHVCLYKIVHVEILTGLCTLKSWNSKHIESPIRSRVLIFLHVDNIFKITFLPVTKYVKIFRVSRFVKGEYFYRLRLFIRVSDFT